MTDSFQAAITEGLLRVDRVRRLSQSDQVLAGRLAEIKRHQHDRFRRDYADLLSSPRYAAAATFFLEDLYGPGDFAARDAEFSRVIPALSRLLPKEMLHTVDQLIELHALSEEFDQRLAQAHVGDRVDEASYRAAWRAVGGPSDRERQLDLLLAIGEALDRHTRTALLAKALRLMRAPARAAGLARLQSFLERGLAAFSAMHGASDFLDRIEANERRFILDMFKR
jgi:hypothetical protein